jgi:hypothetical protein
VDIERFQSIVGCTDCPAGKHSLQGQNPCSLYRTAAHIWIQYSKYFDRYME